MPRVLRCDDVSLKNELLSSAVETAIQSVISEILIKNIYSFKASTYFQLKMLNIELLNRLELISKFAYLVGTSPFKFSVEKGLCFVPLWGKVKSHCILIFIIYYVAIFMPYKAIQLWLKKDYEQCCYLMIMWLGAVEGITVMCMIVVRCTEMAYMITCVLKFVWNFTGNFQLKF